MYVMYAVYSHAFLSQFFMVELFLNHSIPDRPHLALGSDRNMKLWLILFSGFTAIKNYQLNTDSW